MLSKLIFGAFAVATQAIDPQPAYTNWWDSCADDKQCEEFESGLKVRVIQSGEGSDAPQEGTTCSCHYCGWLPEDYLKGAGGKKFDSSRDRGSPTKFAPNQVIKGWTEAMQKMVKGDRWEFHIPYAMAYGERGIGGTIPAKADLVKRIFFKILVIWANFEQNI